jgi:hypothetical protein
MKMDTWDECQVCNDKEIEGERISNDYLNR